MYNFAQVPQRTIEGVAVQEAEPVKTSPTVTPDSIGVYGVQGLVITLLFSLGKPLLDKLYLAFNENAKIKADKENRALDAQLKQTQLLQDAFTDQQNFFQEMIKESQVKSTAAVIASTAQNTDILATLAKSLSGIETKVLSNNDFLQEIANLIKTGKPLKITVDRIGGVVEVRADDLDKEIRAEIKDELRELKGYIAELKPLSNGEETPKV